MTKSLGRRLGRHGIRVNAIPPGLINTAMGARVPEISKQRALSSALGRPGEPEEIASATKIAPSRAPEASSTPRHFRASWCPRAGRETVANFLVSDAASFVTCTPIEVSGGA
jgi:NAD(P)-dependent dehydrogenase (short-subunit alcohol dehydrogenase family)